MKYYRVYNFPDNGYVVIQAKTEQEALKEASKHNYNQETQFALETTVSDFYYNIFSIRTGRIKL